MDVLIEFKSDVLIEFKSKENLLKFEPLSIHVTIRSSRANFLTNQSGLGT